MIENTPEQIARYYSSAMDSVNLINRLNAQVVQSDDEMDIIKANKEHLLIMLGKNYWTTEDLSPLELSASDVPQPYVPLVRTLPEAVKSKLNELSKVYQSAIQQDVAYMGTAFQADTASQQVLTASLSPGSVPAGFAWLDVGNAPVSMTYADLQGLAGAMLAQGFTAFVRLQMRKTVVCAATTIGEVDAVIW